MRNVRISSVAAHIAGWILFLSLPVLFITGQPGNKDLLSIISAPYTWLFFLVYIFIFYLNTYLLIPFLYLKKKVLLYIGILILLFAAVIFLRPFDNLLRTVTGQGQGNNRPREDLRFIDKPPMPPPGSGPHDKQEPPPNKPGKRYNVDIVSIFLFMLVLAFSIAIDSRRRLKLTEQRVLRAEADKANAELSFLKAQINPHFLFNTLNNIYSLAVMKSEHTAESIMKLSNIMRYVTDDVRDDFVSLDNEIACMGDYIDLQRLRLGKKMNVDFSVTGDTKDKKIAPLVLMTFIENVFKYGISNHEQSDIIIRISADEKNILFFSQNKLFEKERSPERTGIGIANTRHRLEHLYPGAYTLDISTANRLFTVQLGLSV